MTIGLTVLLRAAVLATALTAAVPVAAQSLGEASAQRAQGALSERYTQLWSQMPAADRSSFARAERHWLHVTRWSEQQRCTDARGAALPPAEQADRAAHCLAEVTQRRLRSLPQAALAAR
jgi:type II secretory pathway pseudopilin PulG